VASCAERGNDQFDFSCTTDDTLCRGRCS